MIEGGATVNAAALASQRADKLFLYYAPVILGAGAVPIFRRLCNPDLPVRASDPPEYPTPPFRRRFRVEGYLRDPYTD